MKLPKDFVIDDVNKWLIAHPCTEFEIEDKDGYRLTYLASQTNHNSIYYDGHPHYLGKRIFYVNETI